MHLFPLDSALHFLVCAHKSPRLHPEASFSIVFPFAEFLASVTTYFELTSEFLSLTLLLRSNQKLYSTFLLNIPRKHGTTQMPQRLFSLAQKNS